MFTIYAQETIWGMSNDALLETIARHQSAMSNGSESGESLRALRTNLPLLLAERTERVALQTLIVAPPRPQEPVYAPATTPERELRKRLNVLNLQAARYGINTPPEIAIEIEDIERKLR